MTTALALALALVGPAVAGADDDPAARRAERGDVAAAKDAVHSKAADVEPVQARLALAEHRLEQTEIAAAQAVEAFNAARYRAQQAGRGRARRPGAADEAAPTRRAAGRVRRRRHHVVPPRPEPEPARRARREPTGSASVLENTTLIQQAPAAIEDTYETYEATAVLAQAADERADAAPDEAADAKAETKSARDDAEAAASTPPTRPRRTPPSATA